MARTTSVPCRRDLACYRNDGHDGDHAYATPDTVPSPAPIWQAGYDAGYREAQEDIAFAAPPSEDAAPLREALERIADLGTRDDWPQTAAEAIGIARSALPPNAEPKR